MTYPKYTEQTLTVGGITYYEHRESVSKRRRETELGNKLSEPIFACPGRFTLTKKQIIDRYLLSGA